MGTFAAGIVLNRHTLRTVAGVTLQVRDFTTAALLTPDGGQVTTDAVSGGYDRFVVPGVDSVTLVAPDGTLVDLVSVEAAEAAASLAPRLTELEARTGGVPIFGSQAEAQAWELVNPGRPALWWDSGYVEPVFFDNFTASDGTPLHGRSASGGAWVDSATADVWGLTAFGTREQSTISANRVPSSSVDGLRSGQVDIGPGNHVRVSARLSHDGTNPGSGYRSVRIGLAKAEFGALATNAGTPDVVTGIYMFYEGGTGFRAFSADGAWPEQIGGDYTGHGTGAIETTMAIEYDGAEARFLVDGVVRGSVAFPGFTGTIATWALGRVSGWWIDDFMVEPI